MKGSIILYLILIILTLPMVIIFFYFEYSKLEITLTEISKEEILLIEQNWEMPLPKEYLSFKVIRSFWDSWDDKYNMEFILTEDMRSNYPAKEDLPKDQCDIYDYHEFRKDDLYYITYEYYSGNASLLATIVEEKGIKDDSLYFFHMLLAILGYIAIFVFMVILGIQADKKEKKNSST